MTRHRYHVLGSIRTVAVQENKRRRSATVTVCYMRGIKHLIGRMIGRTRADTAASSSLVLAFGLKTITTITA